MPHCSSRVVTRSVGDDECWCLHCVVSIIAVLVRFTRLTPAAVATEHINHIYSNDTHTYRTSSYYSHREQHLPVDQSINQSITHTHTHTRLTALFPGLPRWATTRKVKPIWILLKQVTVSDSGISWAICKSAPCSRQTTTAALHHSNQSINDVKFLGRRYTARPGAPTIVSGKYYQKVNSSRFLNVPVSVMSWRSEGCSRRLGHSRRNLVLQI